MNITRRTLIKGIVGGAAALALPGPLVGAEAEDRARRIFALGRWAGDDTALIQAMIDAAHAAGGGRVLLAPRTYRITGKVSLRSNVDFDGGGRSLIVSPFGHHPFTIGRDEFGVVVRNLVTVDEPYARKMGWT